MKLIIDINENVYKDLKEYFEKEYFDAINSCGLGTELAIANGTPLSKFLEELKRKILMEVDGGTDDMYLRYTDVYNRISNSIDEYKAESEELKGE